MNRDHRWVWIVLGVLLLVVLLGPFLSGGMMGPGMMWGYGGPGVTIHGNGWAWGFGMGLAGLAMLAFWGALIVGGILLARWLLDQASTQRSQGSEDPLTILQRRYAAGEIDQATYARIKRELTGGRADEASRTNGPGPETPVLPSRGPSGSP
jgi:uncharacterized membrane protein